MKKTFTDKIQQKAVNPTLQFISEAASEPQKVEAPKRTPSTSGTPQRAPQARRALSDEETKSRRLQLLLTPSLYDQLRDKAAEERMSVNEMINVILRDFLRK